MTQTSTALQSMPTPEPKKNSNKSALQLVSRSVLSPRGLQNYFTPVGDHGLRVKCHYCGALPPQGVQPWQRWKWLSIHTTMRHHQTPPPRFKTIEGKR